MGGAAGYTVGRQVYGSTGCTLGGAVGAAGGAALGQNMAEDRAAEKARERAEAARRERARVYGSTAYRADRSRVSYRAQPVRADRDWREHTDRGRHLGWYKAHGPHGKHHKKHPHRH